MDNNTTSVADYQVLLGSQFTLDASKNKTILAPPDIHTFHVPIDMITTGSSRQPILAFKARPFEDSAFLVTLNGEPLFSATLLAGHTFGYWQVLSNFGAVLAPSSPTESEFKFILTEGRLRVSDVVLWYQVNKPWD